MHEHTQQNDQTTARHPKCNHHLEELDRQAHGLAKVEHLSDRLSNSGPCKRHLAINHVRKGQLGSCLRGLYIILTGVVVVASHEVFVLLPFHRLALRQQLVTPGIHTLMVCVIGSTRNKKQKALSPGVSRSLAKIAIPLKPVVVVAIVIATPVSVVIIVAIVNVAVVIIAILVASDRCVETVDVVNHSILHREFICLIDQLEKSHSCIAAKLADTELAAIV